MVIKFVSTKLKQLATIILASNLILVSILLVAMNFYPHSAVGKFSPLHDLDHYIEWCKNNETYYFFTS